MKLKIRTLAQAKEHNCLLGDEIILPEPVRKVKKQTEDIKNDKD